jgi:glycogen(starch) synthase
MSVIQVLHLQGPSNWGGNLEGIRILFRALDKSRFQPILGGPRSSGYLERFEAEGFETMDIPILSRRDIRGMHRLNRVLRSRKIDVIHSHVRLTDWLGGIASRWIGVPCVSTLHAPFQYTNDLEPLSDGTLPVYGWVLKNLVDHVITVSAALREDAVRILKLPPDRVTHVVNGIDPDWGRNAAGRGAVQAELGIPAESPIVMHVGWFGHRKGQEDLICAFPRVLKALDSAHFIFVGEGNLYRHCCEKAQELGVMEHAHFLGFRNDVGSLINASDVVVLPTYCEGLPRVLLEAGLMGKPVISTRVDGIAELVLDGETGLLVDAGDRDGLAQAIMMLLRDPQRAKQMGERARTRVLENFASHQMARGTEEVYCQVLARRRIAVPITEAMSK